MDFLLRPRLLTSNANTTEALFGVDFSVPEFWSQFVNIVGSTPETYVTLVCAFAAQHGETTSLTEN